MIGKILDWFRQPVPYRGPGHRPLAEPPRTMPRPPAPPAGPAGASSARPVKLHGHTMGAPTMPTGPLPVEAQIFLRVMGEDLSGARDLLRDMPPLERAILLFYTEQIAGLVYEIMAQEEI